MYVPLIIKSLERFGEYELEKVKEEIEKHENKISYKKEKKEKKLKTVK